MLRVDGQTAPTSFYKTVTLPGRRYLAAHSDAKGRVLPALWNKCRESLYRRYNGVCAYLAVWIPECAGYEVDHYEPKARSPHLAFEWSNLRLSCPHVNRLKGAHVVCDPFAVTPGALSVNFLTGRVSVACACAERELLEKTIQILQLNEGAARKPRQEAYMLYKKGEISVCELTRRYPFAAFEMLRQQRLRKEDVGKCLAVLKDIGYKTAVESLSSHLIRAD